MVQPCWIPTLEDMTTPELGLLLQHDDSPTTRKIWPLGLLAFKKCCTIYSLKRQLVDSIRTSVTEGIKSDKVDQIQREQEQTDLNIQPGGKIKDGQYLILEHCYRKHVKPKKQHEITNLGEVLNTLAGISNCSHVVDVGAGQGHLSRLLAFGYGLDVTTVEAVDCHAPKARQFDSEVKADLEKQKRGKRKKKEAHKSPVPTCTAPFGAPLHLTTRIDPTVSTAVFLEEIQMARQKKETYDDTIPDLPKKETNLCGSTSLHCTNRALSSSMPFLSKGKTLNNLTYSENGGTTHAILKTLSQNYIKNDKTDIETSSNNIEHVQLPDEEVKRCAMESDHWNYKYINNGSFCHKTCICMCNNKQELDLDPKEENAQLLNKVPGFILTGLHACGDLSPTMLRVFVQCPVAKSVASVACCYMKLTTDRPSGNAGYPMSQYVEGLVNHELTYEAREMACHFVDTYCQRLKDNSAHLKSHVYRCALQEIIHDKDASIQHGCIRLSLKNVTDMTFAEYADKALPRLGLDGKLTDFQLQRAEQRLKCWKDVVAFFTIRLCLAPVVETVLLLDRMLYLAEQGVSCCLVPIFDPTLSPRNFVLIAKK